MTNHTFIAAILGTMLIAGTPALAQDLAPPLPAICDPHPGHAMAEPEHEGHDAGGMDQPHLDLMAGMDETNAQMMTGMTAADIDVAFVCGMIPHHQAALNMARAELLHGDDPWAREFAQKVIDAQQAEIEEMRAWLEQQ
jgi:uncharacterized protein (DUF305 family)